MSRCSKSFLLENPCECVQRRMALRSQTLPPVSLLKACWWKLGEQWAARQMHPNASTARVAHGTLGLLGQRTQEGAVSQSIPQKNSTEGWLSSARHDHQRPDWPPCFVLRHPGRLVIHTNISGQTLTCNTRENPHP